MKKKYCANSLYVGRIMYISNELGGPFVHETKMKYIFEARSISQTFYKEISTGIKIQREEDTYKDGFNFKSFNTPYIINLESFLNYYPDEINKMIHARSMILRMNEINNNIKEKQQQAPTKKKRL